MTMEIAFGRLCTAFRDMQAALVRVQKETEADESLGESTRGMVALVEDALAAAERGRRAAVPPVNFDRVRATLPRCQQRFDSLIGALRTNLGSPARLDELSGAGRHGTVYAVRCCYEPFFACGRTLVECWRSMSAYAAATFGAPDQHP